MPLSAPRPLQPLPDPGRRRRHPRVPGPKTIDQLRVPESGARRLRCADLKGDLNPARHPARQGLRGDSDQKLSQLFGGENRKVTCHRSSSESAAERRPQPRSPVCQDRESLSVLQLSALSRPRATISAPHSSSSDPRPGIAGRVPEFPVLCYWGLPAPPGLLCAGALPSVPQTKRVRGVARVNLRRRLRFSACRSVGMVDSASLVGGVV